MTRTPIDELSQAGAAYATGDVCSSCLQGLGADPDWASWAAVVVTACVRIGIWLYERRERRAAASASVTP